MREERDYGEILDGGTPMSQYTPGFWVDTTHNGQVYMATHDGGGLRLPFMNRSFMSFSFGGKHIEDFNFLSTIENNRIDADLYAGFTHRVTTYDNLDGQQYWGTHYNSPTFTFNLSTDGIDQRLLDDFKHWFRAGETRELILAEHPNRAILARVADVPQMHLLPFETTIPISAGTTVFYTTRTTLYRGEVVLKLVADQPHWYALDNVLGIKIKDDTYKERYIDQWINANGVQESIFASEDALKILYEDGIPLGSSIDNDMLLGNGGYAKIEDNTDSYIWSPEETDAAIRWVDGEPSGIGARVNGTLSFTEWADMYYLKLTDDNDKWLRMDVYTPPPANPDEPVEPTPWFDDCLVCDDGAGDLTASLEHVAHKFNGIIAGAIIDASGNGIRLLEHDTPAYFFYAGTAPAFTKISFILTPEINSSYYITTPANSITGDTPYNTITIMSRTAQYLQFTTPSVYTSYNNALKVITQQKEKGATWEEVFSALREEVRHPAIRDWAAMVINVTKNNYATLADADMSYIGNLMSYFLKDETGHLYTAEFCFNSETGEAIGKFNYRTYQGFLPIDWPTYGLSTTIKEEDVGDMLRSNYIVLRERNYPNDEGRVVKWDSAHPLNSHMIQHNVPTALQKVQIIYKNMYL